MTETRTIGLAALVPRANQAQLDILELEIEAAILEIAVLLHRRGVIRPQLLHENAR